MVTEHHSFASRILLKGVSIGPLVAGLVSMDVGSANCVASQNQQVPEHSTNRALPQPPKPCVISCLLPARPPLPVLSIPPES
eukprot:198016-Pelagomonas_calceolata.AAC.5